MWTTLESPAYLLQTQNQSFPFVPSGHNKLPVYFSLGAAPVAEPAPAQPPPPPASAIVPLPSQQTIVRIVQGDTSPQAFAIVLRDWVLRGGIIGIGLFCAGVRKPEDLIKYGLSGAAAIELFVLIHTLRYNNAKPQEL